MPKYASSNARKVKFFLELEDNVMTELTGAEQQTGSTEATIEYETVDYNVFDSMWKRNEVVGKTATYKLTGTVKTGSDYIRLLEQIIVDGDLGSHNNRRFEIRQVADDGLTPIRSIHFDNTCFTIVKTSGGEAAGLMEWEIEIMGSSKPYLEDHLLPKKLPTSDIKNLVTTVDGFVADITITDEDDIITGNTRYEIYKVTDPLNAVASSILIVGDNVATTEATLDANEEYIIYIKVSFDEENGAGIQNHQVIGGLSFTTTIVV